MGGTPVAIPGAKPRAILTMLGLRGGSVVSADTLIELLWGDDPPRTAAKALQTHISALRRTLGDGVVLTMGTGWTLCDAEVDASRYKVAARLGRDAVAAGDTNAAVASFEEALSLWRGIPELPEGQRGASERTRWIEAHAALVEDRADALLATGRAAEIIGELEAAVADAPLRERRWGQLMLALYRAGRQGEALAAYQRARSLLVDQLGVDPGPELRRLEAAIVAQDATLDSPVAQQASGVTRAVTFLLTDIEGSTAAWEADADAMGAALARHDELIEQVVTSRGGRLIKTRGEGDATFSVFDRPSAAAAGAIEMQEAIAHEPWALVNPLRIRVALHTGEVELRDGDYFGRAVNRAARLRSLASGGQILCSGATAELVIDSLSDDVVLADLGLRQLRNLPRPEHVFELRLQTADDEPASPEGEASIERPDLPAVLSGRGPFVGRGQELQSLSATWQTTLTGGMRAMLIAGEPGVGKTRLAGEWSRQAFEQGAIVLYGRCDEDLGAPYQPFAEALRSLVPCLGASRLRGLRGIEALLPLVPGLTDVLPDLAAPTRADPDTERYALFDAVVALLESVSASVPVVLILDDLHWAAKSTLLLLRHLLRFGDQARVQIVGTYRSTDLDRSHPLAAMLADLHRDGTAERLQLSGLDEEDVTTYVAEAGYDDEELGRALASVTGGNPFFLIEALRHVDESGGVWDQSTLPQGVREAVSRRLSRLPTETNKALAAAAVVGSRFAVDLVERVVDQDLVDAFDEACKAGILIEEPGGRYRFNHALIRQSLLAELPSVRRMRLHQRIATTLENEPGADDELLAEVAHHYFECAWAGNALKAVEYCRRAADQAMARLAYEGAADLYDHALHALEEIDDELPDREDQTVELLVARCEALLAAGDVVSAAAAVTQLQDATRDSARISAWAGCYEGQLSMLTHPERLDAIESAVSEAAQTLAELNDPAGEATAHTVRALCLGRLGRIGDAEIALDRALTAARSAREHRRVNAVLAVAPLAALWGPNPVPRAGGRCLDVVRLLRITTDSPAVEATSTRCQAVLEAFRGRAPAAHRMIESAKRTVSELGLRHAMLEVEQFAGIIELVVGDAAAAEPHLRKAYNGFRRMGLDADTAETAALLGRACQALDRDAEADELCSESERLAGHALKASIAWRTLRAQLASRRGDHDEAKRTAEEAITLAERTDALVDHGDACLTLATVLGAAGDASGARAAAERAAELYERKGAAALVERARALTDAKESPASATLSEEPAVALHNACVRAMGQLKSAMDRDDWDEVERLFADSVVVESRRRIVGFAPIVYSRQEWTQQLESLRGVGAQQARAVLVAIRGERLALSRLRLTADPSADAPEVEGLQLLALDERGRICQHLFFDLEDEDAATAELDALHAAYDQTKPQAPQLENAASRVYERFKSCFASRDWDGLGALIADDICTDDRRWVVNAGIRKGRSAVMEEVLGFAELGATAMTTEVVAARGERLILNRSEISDWRGPQASIDTKIIELIETDTDERVARRVVFDTDDFDSAFAELDARYMAGEGAPHARTWAVATRAQAALDHRRELPPTTADWVNLDHWPLQDVSAHVEVVHRLNDAGTVYINVLKGSSTDGFDADWRMVELMMVKDDLISHVELFDEADLDVALARFDELHQQKRRLENAASRVSQRYGKAFAARDWAAVDAQLAQGFYIDDRRPTVNAGIRRGRDAEMKDLRAAADIGFTDVATTVIATRGEHLVLARSRFATRDEQSRGFENEILHVTEIDSDEQMAAVVVFESDDLDAAFAELDARYITGEAAPYADTWSLLSEGYKTINQGGTPPAAPDYVIVDHRLQTAIEADKFTEYMDASRKLTPDLYMYIEAVHRLGDNSVVFTNGTAATSQDGFDADWRIVEFLTIENGLGKRCELFDEADLDKALALFDEMHQHERRLENQASRVLERYLGLFEARDWESMAAILADDFSADDRRHVVNGGLRTGGDAEIANVKAIAEIGCQRITSTPIAVRGGRAVLARHTFMLPDWPEPFDKETIDVVEVDADGRIVRQVVFDADDLDAAYEELDTAYLAGEAAPYARVWRDVISLLAEVNRHQPGTLVNTIDYFDHRRVSFAPGDFRKAVEELWTLVPDARYRAKAVHALDAIGIVATLIIEGTDTHGSELHWAQCLLLAVDPPRVHIYEEDAVDSALARFASIHPQGRRLENAATRVHERTSAFFETRNWAALANAMAPDVCDDDRRSVANGGVQYGPEHVIANSQNAVALGADKITLNVTAVRGDRLALSRVSYRGSNLAPDAFRLDVLAVVEIRADEKVAAYVAFDPDDFEAALAELEKRYIAGEAAPYARTWSALMGGHAAFNRRELPSPTTQFLDHRAVVPVNSGDLSDNLRAIWDLTPDFHIFVEAVHELSERGAVVTQRSHGTSQQGFEAEWRVVGLFAVDGDSVERFELFDEGDLDTALALFGELHRHERRLENSASRAYERAIRFFEARDWVAMAEAMSPTVYAEDRRHVANGGTLRGVDDLITNSQAGAALGATDISINPLADRGDRLALIRLSIYGLDPAPDAFSAEMLAVVQIDEAEKLSAYVAFDPDDIDAAVGELDKRYMANEPAAHARVWSVAVRAQAAPNRWQRALPKTTPDWISIDHRRGIGFPAGHLTDYLHAWWESEQDCTAFIESVHRLTDRGTVFVNVLTATSTEGFPAEWRFVELMMVDGDLISRVELFEETDLEVAVAKFDELMSRTRLENAATRIGSRIADAFNCRDRETFYAFATANGSFTDRRQGLNSGTDGLDLQRNLHATLDIAPLSWEMTWEPIAIRGTRLSLEREYWRDLDQDGQPITVEFLSVVEANDSGLLHSCVLFDVDDVDAAFAELETRYLAGEAAEHADTWKVFIDSYAALKRGEIPSTTDDFVDIDHRSLVPIETGELITYLNAFVNDLAVDNVYVESAHRLTDLGAVVTHVATGTSQDGFAAEWRVVYFATLDRGLINRTEVFEEADLDTALARFDELAESKPRLGNAASITLARFQHCFSAQDWDAIAETVAPDFLIADRRRAINSGVERGRDAVIELIRNTTDSGTTHVESTTVATRGTRLLLARASYSGDDHGPEQAFRTELLSVVEANGDGKLSAQVVFDVDDVNAAFAELEKRYLTGEAAAHAHTWSVLVRGFAAISRKELPAISPDFVDVDHRAVTPVESGDLLAYFRSMFDAADVTVYVDSVQRLTSLGAVVTHTGVGTSREGFEAEWRMVEVLTVREDLITRCEIFDEADLDAALARFDELSRTAPRNV